MLNVEKSYFVLLYTKGNTSGDDSRVKNNVLYVNIGPEIVFELLSGKNLIHFSVPEE